MTRRHITRGLLAVALVLFAVTRAPQVLAFPHHATIGATEIWSEQPIGPEFPKLLARADALIAASPLAGGDMSRALFLTDGGWRWRLLALADGGSYGFRRPWSSVLVFDRSNMVGEQVHLGGPVGRRTLSGTIAHETSHLLVARRIGEVAALRLPQWVSEGLADHVARESALSDAEAAGVRRTDPGRRALIYYDARRRVAAALAAPGGSVDRLLAEGR